MFRRICGSIHLMLGGYGDTMSGIRSCCLLLLFLFSASRPVSSASDRFKPDAIVTLADGRTISVSEKKLYTDHYPSPYGRYLVQQSKSAELLINLDGLWKAIDTAEIRTLVFNTDTKKPDWLAAEITLNSGGKVSGDVPSRVSLTWMNGGDEFCIEISRLDGSPRTEFRFPEIKSIVCEDHTNEVWFSPINVIKRIDFK